MLSPRGWRLQLGRFEGQSSLARNSAPLPSKVPTNRPGDRKIPSTAESWDTAMVAGATHGAIPDGCRELVDRGMRGELGDVQDSKAWKGSGLTIFCPTG